MKNLKRFGICTFIYGIVLIVVSILCSIGNWPDDYFKRTMFWFLPTIFSFFIGMTIAAEFFEIKGSIPEDGYCFIASIYFGIIILAFSIIGSIQLWPRNWFYNTLHWWLGSVLNFYLGMKAEAFLDKLKKKEKNDTVDSKPVDSKPVDVKPVDVKPVVVYPQKSTSIKEKINNAKIQDVKFEDVKEGSQSTIVFATKEKTTVSEAASTVPEPKEGPEIIIMNQEEWKAMFEDE